jgi:hypothetical protein
MDSEIPDPEFWARENIHWLHTKRGHNAWNWIAQIRAEGLIFEGRAHGPSGWDGLEHEAVKKRAEDAAVSDYMDFVHRTG